MAISKKARTVPCPGQLSYLSSDPPISEGQMADIPHGLRAALVVAIKPCALSRYEIAAKISELLSRDISKTSLDRWCAESAEEHRIPAEVLAPFCLVTGSRTPLEVLATAIGCELVGPEEVKELEVTRLRIEKTNLERRIKELERRR